ncbi:hypothetical protein [Magnetospirillum sp. UT-4]|uniref:hypothetical protein n=1 Tax=Magnetospirillum sp. UT-4 TaxID=2681467 RepID=UPI001384982C|nr:hypothetical protein [Magnetospirillum sp. UT-4]CAA7615261.1 hypothetical protein MTBUT4_20147 [Magnetospirillum sp. UT-4]
MVQMVNLTGADRATVTGMVDRFRQDSFHLDELSRIERAHLPGYNGKVEPVRVGDGLDMTMYLACTNPFTVAHELAHVSDISVRREETFANLSLSMPAHWHLAHRMSSEYYANRVACAYVEEGDVLGAFRNDAAGLRGAVARSDWADAMIHYALLLGILHGNERPDCDPLKLVPGVELPGIVADGLSGFRDRAAEFFDGYREDAPALAA